MMCQPQKTNCRRGSRLLDRMLHAGRLQLQSPAHALIDPLPSPHWIARSQVEPTAIAALNMNWPGSKLTVHVLDDGKRPEMAQLVRRLAAQCRYMQVGGGHSAAQRANACMCEAVWCCSCLTACALAKGRAQCELRPGQCHAAADDCELMPAQPARPALLLPVPRSVRPRSCMWGATRSRVFRTTPRRETSTPACSRRAPAR